MALVVKILALLTISQRCLANDPAEMSEIYFKHSGASGTQHGKKKDAGDYFESNSAVPHLPSVSGFMGTHGTYRFMTVHEQTAVVIGDGKHGIWRIQENGMIREYRKKGRIGLARNVDPNQLNPSGSAQDRLNLDIIEKHYAAYIPEEGWGGYKYPDQKLSVEGYLNFVDLSIYHPKYKGVYDNHTVIDLPHWYCTMTQNDYPHVYDAWKYAVAQPRANLLGPLGIRAGMDIKENYHQVLRFELFRDSGLWANVGVNSSTDKVATTINEVKSRVQTVNYQRVDLSKMDVEVYLFERPFFNKPFIFITIIVDQKPPTPSQFSYVRPHGPYYNQLVARNKTVTTNQVRHFPKLYVTDYPSGQRSVQTVYGLPTYGHHHPRRHLHNLIGGACPNRGGDWGRYPWSNSGSGFPTNYEEVTPLCDGIVVDMKMWWNLQVPSWTDKNLFQGNAGFDGKLVVNYTADTNIYGRYTDPYLLSINATNPYEMKLTNDIIESDSIKQPRVNFQLKFSRPGAYLGFTNISVPKKAPQVETVDMKQEDVNKMVEKLASIVANVSKLGNRRPQQETQQTQQASGSTALPPTKQKDEPAANFFGGGSGKEDVDAAYITLCMIVVFTMQSGFALLESGCCSARSEANIMAKNMIDVALGGLVYWFIGYGFSFGGNTKPSNKMAGEGYFILDVDISGPEVGNYIYYAFHCSFATATATITSGGVAERIKLTSYMIFAMIDTAMIYPICCHWAWHPDGLFYNYINDFSGSSVVHMCGGASALAGMMILGPRLGRYKKGNEKYFRPSNYTSLVLGTFFLWWGWLGFNGGAQGVMSGTRWHLPSRIVVVTLNASMGGAAAAILFNLVMSKKRGILLDIGEVCEALLGALVAICAPCASIHPWEAIVIGAIGGWVTIAFVYLLNALHIDDPVGCFAVHWGAGLWGVIAAAFFSDGLPPSHNGIFRGGTGAVLGWNIVCAITITIWSFGVSAIVFLGLKYTIGLRITEEEEIKGLDVVDHNVDHSPYDYQGYAEFVGKRYPKDSGKANGAMEMDTAA